MTCIVVTGLISKGFCENKKYFSLERPKITFAHPQYYSNVIFKSSLKSRLNPIHYVDFNATLLKILDNNYKIMWSFYQLLSNVYKKSFVEHNASLCDALNEDISIAPAFTDGFNRMPPDSRPIPEFKCPLISGIYIFSNMMIATATIQAGFPFIDRRIYRNITWSE